MGNFLGSDDSPKNDDENEQVDENAKQVDEEEKKQGNSQPSDISVDISENINNPEETNLSDEASIQREVIKQLDRNIAKKIERIGTDLKTKGEQDKIDYFVKFIEKIENKLKCSKTNKEWKTKVANGCVKLFQEASPSLTTVKEYLHAYMKDK